MLLRHEGELTALTEQLRVTNSDLDSFAHAAAHDLKEPPRGIFNAATFVIEDAAADLDATTVRRMLTMRPPELMQTAGPPSVIRLTGSFALVLLHR
ncbi:hypothetical protein [Streptomyces sp. NPDC055681]